jgi:acyl-CoA thioester hydrolase
MCRTRFGDTDAYGHINNVTIGHYIQEAVLHLLPGAGRGTAELFPDEFLFVRNEVDFLAQVYHRPEPFPIQVWVESIGTSSFTLASEAHADGVAAFRARTTVVAYDRSANRSRPLSPGERRLLVSALPGVRKQSDPDQDGGLRETASEIRLSV